jgi:hypothetical protein
LCIGLLAGLVALSVSPPASDAPPVVAPGTAMTNADCRGCHQAVWDEWSGSLHAVSWTSPDVQAAFQHFGHDRKCESCHAPVPVFVSGLEKPVEFRADRREEGVGCLSCHLLPDGSVAARSANLDAPCRPVATPELSASLQCGGCHTAIYEDWQQSNYAAQAKTCQTCHMPGQESRAGGFNHSCAGGLHADVLRSAATLDCEVQGQELVVTVRNTGTGHNFPGERHNRVLLVDLVETNAEDEIVLGQQQVIKHITPFRGESSAEQIRAGESSVLRFEIVERASLANVRLIYKRFPWLKDEDSVIVHQQEVNIE